MIILGISTSGRDSSIALRRDGETAVADTFPGARSCVEELIPRIDKLLTGCGCELRDIDRIGIDIGPGGLTGIKIGLVAARTLAQTLELPVAPVSGLHALCVAAPASNSLLLPTAPCTKSEFYAALFRQDTGGGITCVEQDALHNADTLSKLLEKTAPSELLVVGEVSDAARAAIEKTAGARARLCGLETVRPAAVAVCEIAANSDPVDWRRIQPNYLCLTNAERTFGIRA